MTEHAHPHPLPRWRPIAAAGFRAHVRLADGARLTLRPIRPSDKPRLSALMARLSDQSRFRRFLTAKSRLTDDELTYLTDVDHHHHVALLALDDDGDAMAVARCIQDPHLVGEAEAAIVVADELQGRGLGRQLLDTLLTAARERDVQRVHLETHVDNLAMRHLAQRYDATVITMSQGIAHFVIDLS